MAQPVSPVYPYSPETNEVVFAKNQPQYLPLPAVFKNGIVTSRWKLSWKERIQVLFNGSVYLMVRCGNDPLQPVKIVASEIDAKS